jgi:Domain of unknown function (DUF3854)
VNPHLDFLLSSVYDNSPLHHEHLADLRKSGLTNETIELHKIRTVPPAMIGPLLGFGASRIRHAYLIPFPDTHGGFMDHVRMKVFSNDDAMGADVRGDQVEEHRERWRYNGGQRKYLVRRQSTSHLYFPLPTLRRAIEDDEALWIVEGPKKALAVAQLGLPVVGIESAWGWHLKGSRELLPDFDTIMIKGRLVKVVPDPDAQGNPEIARAMHSLAEALERRGAYVQLVMLPTEVAA